MRLRIIPAALFGSLLLGCTPDTFSGPDAMMPDDGSVKDVTPADATADVFEGGGMEGGQSDGGVPLFSCSPPPMNMRLCTTFDGLTSTNPSWTSDGWTDAFV